MTETQQQTLETLLRRWAELEPDRCTWHYDDCYLLGTGNWKQEVEADDSVVQLFVQKAIEARGWKWNIGLSTSDQATGPFWADIDTITGSTFWCYADTPSAALLSIYLQALEAQQ